MTWSALVQFIRTVWGKTLSFRADQIDWARDRGGCVARDCLTPDRQGKIWVRAFPDTQEWSVEKKGGEMLVSTTQGTDGLLHAVTDRFPNWLSSQAAYSMRRLTPPAPWICLCCKSNLAQLGAAASLGRL